MNIFRSSCAFKSAKKAEIKFLFLENKHYIFFYCLAKRVTGLDWVITMIITEYHSKVSECCESVI